MLTSVRYDAIPYGQGKHSSESYFAYTSSVLLCASIQCRISSASVDVNGDESSITSHKTHRWKITNTSTRPVDTFRCFQSNIAFGTFCPKARTLNFYGVRVLREWPRDPESRVVHPLWGPAGPGYRVRDQGRVAPPRTNLKKSGPTRFFWGVTIQGCTTLIESAGCTYCYFCFYSIHSEYQCRPGVQSWEAYSEVVRDCAEDASTGGGAAQGGPAEQPDRRLSHEPRVEVVLAVVDHLEVDVVP
jgi:hypothetical protein